MKRKNSAISVLLALALVFGALLTTASAAAPAMEKRNGRLCEVEVYATNSLTINAKETMSLFLNAGITGDSNGISFNFRSLPDGAVVKEIKFDAGSGTHMGGFAGAVVPKLLKLTSPGGVMRDTAWGAGHKTTVVAFTGKDAGGTWWASFEGTNIGSQSAGIQFKAAKMTITYIY